MGVATFKWSRDNGTVVTDKVDGCILEAGADSFLTEKPWAIELCKKIGLGDQLIGSNDADRKTYILVKGRLVPLPDGLMFMVPTRLMSAFFSPLFSWGTKARAAEPSCSAPPSPTIIASPSTSTVPGNLPCTVS